MKNMKNLSGHVLADQTKSYGNVAFIVSDKVLLSIFFRALLLGHTISSGHEHANKKVLIFKNDAFLESDDSDNKIVFIPCMLVDNDSEEHRVIPFPAYMLKLSHKQIMETISYLEKNSHDNCKKDYFKLFFKPKVTITYDDRIDLGSEYFGAENEDCHFQLADERPGDIVLELEED